MVTRRLIGPTVITLMICVIWVDYVFFRESLWSPSGFLSRIFAILIKIFAPLFNPALYWWIGEIFIPGGMIVCAIILLYVSVAKAKVAMSKVTPNMDEALPMPLPKHRPIPQPARVVEAVESKPSNKLWKFGLARKLTSSFGILGLLFGLTATLVAHRGLASMFEKEIKLRAELSVTSLGELANRRGAQAELELRRAIDKYRRDSSIAYIYVEDAEGRIVAHMPQELPRFLPRDFAKNPELAIHGVEVKYRGLPVFEIATRVGEPKRGYVHLAIRRDVIQEENLRVMRPIIASILVALCALTVVFAWSIWRATRPFVELVHYANRISHGDLGLDIVIKEGSDEISDLERSFARMRSSLYAVLTRIEKARANDRSSG